MSLMEQPYTIVIAGVFIVAVLAGGFIQTGKRVLLYASLFAILATVGVLFLERTTITPREEVKATLFMISHELENNNVEGVLQYISDGRPKLKHDAASKMGLVTIREVDIKRNLKVEIVTARGGEIAEAKFNCVIHTDRIQGFESMMDTAQRVPRFFVVRFKQDEDGRWRVRDYEMKDPRSGMGS